MSLSSSSSDPFAIADCCLFSGLFADESGLPSLFSFGTTPFDPKSRLSFSSVSMFVPIVDSDSTLWVASVAKPINA